MLKTCYKSINKQTSSIMFLLAEDVRGETGNSGFTSPLAEDFEGLPFWE